MTDRRYSDDEVSRIFARAAEGPRAQPGQATNEQGLTLAELQAIGKDVGIAPDAIANAVRTLEAQPVGGIRRYAGLPIGVHRTVMLNRWLTDAEWERVVVQLREVFNARGTLRSHGTFREWSNGNLQALLEPTESGHRLRLTTTKGSARSGISFGLIVAGVGAAIAISAAAGGRIAAAMPGVEMTALIAAAMLAYNGFPLLGWAKRRAAQMDAIASSVAGAGRIEPPRASG